MVIHYTYDSGGAGTSTLREEYADEVHILSPQDTPRLSLMEFETVSQPTYSWLMDDIPDPTSVNQVREGFTVGTGANLAASNVTRNRPQNICMLDALAVDVSHTQRLSLEGGIDDEYSWQMTHKLLQLAKRADYNLLWSHYQAGAAAQGRQTAGMFEWLYSTGGIATPTGTPHPGSATIAGAVVEQTYQARMLVDATPTTAITEAEFNQLLGNAWGNGMDIGASVLLVGSTGKRVISDFGNVYNSGQDAAGTLTASTHRREISDRTKVMPIDFYASDFGTFGIALDRRLDGTDQFPLVSLGAWSGAAGHHSNLSAAISAEDAAPGADDEVTGTQGNESFVMFDPAFSCVSLLQPFVSERIAPRGNSSEGYVVAEYGYKCKNPISLLGATGVFGGN